MNLTRRNALSVLAALLAMLLLSACAAPALPEATAAPTATATETPVVTAEPTAEPETPLPTETPVVTAAPSPTPTAAPTPTPKGPSMYSSYAYLVSFDPDTGIAKFDYFDMLRDEDAIDYLVKHKGYTQADAEELVENFADSEFVEKNDNPQLRAIDIDDVPLKLMVKPNGDPVDDTEPVSVTAEEFRAIYALNTSLLLESYFYHITVDDGKVTLVEQVYWP
jgi:ABC-type transport system substrate-binding protein